MTILEEKSAIVEAKPKTIEEKPAVAAAKQRAHSDTQHLFVLGEHLLKEIIKYKKRRHQLRCLLLLVQSKCDKKVYIHIALKLRRK